MYDYYLRPGGGYFGTKRACEPLHVQYSYDNRSVVLVNDTPQPAQRLRVAATLLDFNLMPRASREATVDVPADAVRTVFVLPAASQVPGLRLDAHDATGRVVSHNFYWLSARDDQIDWSKGEWYYTPTTRHADLTALASLPATTVSVSSAFESAGDDAAARVTIRNRGHALAFQVRLELVDPSTGAEILPAFWDDNYFELLPDEQREIRVTYPRGSSHTTPIVTADAWNTAHASE